jgi:hypothetical protein
MESDFVLKQAIDLVQASLVGLEMSLPQGDEPASLLLTPLVRNGDALRLRLRVPSGLGKWLEKVSASTLDEVLAEMLNECDSWAIAGASKSFNAERLAGIVYRRDEFESVIMALRRALIVRGSGPANLAHFEAYYLAIQSKDSCLSEIVTRGDVVDMLDWRRGLNPRWSDSFVGSEALDTRTSGEDLPEAAFVSVEPSDEILDAYCSKGLLFKTVESAAARLAAFAERLADVIELLLSAGEPVSLMARIWLKKRGGALAAGNVIAYPILRPVALAAATSLDDDDGSVVLGQLGETGAEGRLELSGKEVVLHVYRGERAIRSVSFGGKSLAQPDSTGVFRLAVPVSRSLMLRVEDDTGASFSGELTLCESSDEN